MAKRCQNDHKEMHNERKRRMTAKRCQNDLKETQTTRKKCKMTKRDPKRPQIHKMTLKQMQKDKNVQHSTKDEQHQSGQVKKGHHKGKM